MCKACAINNAVVPKACTMAQVAADTFARPRTLRCWLCNALHVPIWLHRSTKVAWHSYLVAQTFPHGVSVYDPGHAPGHADLGPDIGGEYRG